MKFHPEHDDTNSLVCRRVSENGIIEIGVWHTIFGHRIRVGHVGGFCCELDYCAGAPQKDVEILYSVVIAILEQQDENNVDWSVFPVQRIKPVFNDSECWRQMMSLAGEFDLVKLPDLNELRDKMRLHIRDIIGDAVKESD